MVEFVTKNHVEEDNFKGKQKSWKSNHAKR